jgi:FKBP-type peptidyl-prolyl cis-trans isomerase (trigger factor)
VEFCRTLYIDDGNNFEYMGQETEVYITVTSIYDSIWENLTDDFVIRNYSEKGLRSVDDYYIWVKNYFTDLRYNEMRNRNFARIYQNIIENSNITINEEELIDYSVQIVEKYEKIANMYGYNNIEEYSLNILKMNETEFYNMCCEEGKYEVSMYIVIGAIAEKEKISYTEQEFLSMCRRMGYQEDERNNAEIKIYIEYEIYKDKINFLLQ